MRPVSGMGDSVFVHERAICETKSIGARTRIWAFAHILEGAAIGSDCNLCDYVFIESDVVLGDRVVVKPGVHICDKVRIEDMRTQTYTELEVDKIEFDVEIPDRLFTRSSLERRGR